MLSSGMSQKVLRRLKCHRLNVSFLNTEKFFERAWSAVILEGSINVKLQVNICEICQILLVGDRTC